MRDDNLPDDCQGNGTHLPWNQPEEEIYACWDCETQVIDEDSTTLDYSVFISPDDITTIDITLLDENNHVLDLNGLDWVLIFRVFT